MARNQPRGERKEAAFRLQVRVWVLCQAPVGTPGASGPLRYLEGEIEQAVELWERARTMSSLVNADRIMLARYYESAGRHEDAQAIVGEMLSPR